MSVLRSFPYVLGSCVLFVFVSITFAQEPPKVPIVEITEPPAGATLQGTQIIKVKITPAENGSVPDQVYVGLGGPPWIRLKDRRVEENVFGGQIDTRLVPNGAQNLIVVTNNRRAKGSVAVNVDNELKVFFADLHSHTGYSDGTLLPFIAHDFARYEAKLDVFCLSDHLEYVDDVEWLDTREEAWDANEDGQFVAFPGLEWTKQWGHLNLYDPKTRHWPEDPSAFYQAAADAGIVVKFNHPGDGSQTHNGLAYSEVGDRAVQLMEVRSEDEEKAFVRALNNGWHIAPEGSDDTHDPNWGRVRSWSGILAPALTKRNILDALAKRHVYSTLDRNFILHFTVNEAVMGDIVEQPVEQVTLLVRTSDPDSSDQTTMIEVIEDGQVIVTNSSVQPTWQTTFWPAPGKHYYYVRITQADGNKIRSAPVWVHVGPVEAPVASDATANQASGTE